MRILFEVLLLSIVVGAVFLFYKILLNYLFPGKKEKEKGESIKGFTLVELLSVVAIIAIFGAIAYPQYQASRAKNDPKYRTQIEKERQAALGCFDYEVEFPKGTTVSIRMDDIASVDETEGIRIIKQDGSEIKSQNYVKNKTSCR